MSELRILAVGDVVGRPGRRAVKELVPGLCDRLGVEFIVANAENAAGGSGLTLDTARELLDAGCDCLTTGDHFFEKPEVKDIIANEPRVLRPANWSRHAPGRGWGVFDSRAGFLLRAQGACALSAFAGSASMTRGAASIRWAREQSM